MWCNWENRFDMQCLDDSLHCMPQHAFLHTTGHAASYKEGSVEIYRCQRKMKSHHSTPAVAWLHQQLATNPDRTNLPGTFLPKSDSAVRQRLHVLNAFVTDRIIQQTRVGPNHSSCPRFSFLRQSNGFACHSLCVACCFCMLFFLVSFDCKGEGMTEFQRVAHRSAPIKVNSPE